MLFKAKWKLCQESFSPQNCGEKLLLMAFVLLFVLLLLLADQVYNSRISVITQFSSDLKFNCSFLIERCYNTSSYSRTSTNGHLSDNGHPALYSGHFNLFCPGGHWVHTFTLIETSPQWPPLYNGNGHKRVSPTAKITSRQRPVFSATDKKIENWHEI